MSFLAIFIAFGISGTPCVSASSGVCSTSDTIIANILKLKSGTAFEATLDASAITANRDAVIIDEDSQTVPDASGTSSGDILEASGAGAIGWVTPSGGAGLTDFNMVAIDITSSPYTYAPGFTGQIHLTLTGGGGGSNGADDVAGCNTAGVGNCTPTGGGGGGSIVLVYDITPATSCTITIGAGGNTAVWATSTFYPGSDGGDSTFVCTSPTINVTAGGGYNSGATAGGYMFNVGGAGGQSTCTTPAALSGCLAIQGGGGAAAGLDLVLGDVQGGQSIWGCGGASYGGGRGTPSNFPGAYVSGGNYGCGGGGLTDGSHGVAVIYEYIY